MTGLNRNKPLLTKEGCPPPAGGEVQQPYPQFKHLKKITESKDTFINFHYICSVKSSQFSSKLKN